MKYDIQKFIRDRCGKQKTNCCWNFSLFINLE